MLARTNIVHRVWADALFALGRDTGDTERFESDLDGVCAAIESEPQFLVFARTPHLRLAAKKSLVKAVFEGRISPLILNFLLLATGKGRLGEIGGIRDAFRALVDQARDRRRVEVTSAVELDEEQRKQLNAEIAAVLGTEVVIQPRVEPRILGGLVIAYGDTQIDGSVALALRTFKNEIKDKIRAPVQS